MAKGTKICFHPMCLYSIYLEFVGEFNNGQKLAFSELVQNLYFISEHRCSVMVSAIVGGTMQLKWKVLGSNPGPGECEAVEDKDG